MNQYSQQQGFNQGQGGQGYQNGQSNNNFNYEPHGYVQSHYQGQLSQPNFGQNQPVISHAGGYQAMNNNSYGNTANSYSGMSNQHYGTQHAGNGQQSYQQHYGTQQHIQPIHHTQSYGNEQHQPVQSHASQHIASQYGDVGPVIAHLGYQASGMEHRQYQPQQGYQGYQSYGQAGYNNASNMHAQGQQGSQIQSSTSQHPVYAATNAYAQSGPVISQLGWQTGYDARNRQS